MRTGPDLELTPWTLALGAPMVVSFPAMKGKRGGQGPNSERIPQPGDAHGHVARRAAAWSRSMQRNRVASDTSKVSPWINGEEAGHIIFMGHNGSAERELVAAATGDGAVGIVVRGCMAAAVARGFSPMSPFMTMVDWNSRTKGNRSGSDSRSLVRGERHHADLCGLADRLSRESATDILKGALEKLVPPRADRAG